MAIDTAEDRWSILAVPLGAPPVPDGGFDDGDRRTFLGLYRGPYAEIVLLAPCPPLRSEPRPTRLGSTMIGPVLVSAGCP